MNESLEQNYRSQSFWLDTVPGSLVPRSGLQDSNSADIVIIGAGYTGLWAAYYLKKHQPDLDIVMLEAEIAGFGASGRNGGWCTSYLCGIDEQLAQPKLRKPAMALQRLMFDAVDEVGRVCNNEAIDCHYDKSGQISAAVTPAQLKRDREHMTQVYGYGLGEQDYHWLSALELQDKVRIAGALGGYRMSHCAAIQPARLARGLAECVERMGVRIFERSPVLRLQGNTLKTPAGAIKAQTILLATEGYTGSLPEVQRKLIPIHSTMIATEPLSVKEIEETGLNGRFTWNNGKHLATYGQLTADGRIAFGNRGRYLFGSGIQNQFSADDPVFELVRNELTQLFPVLEGKPVTHCWGGPMGVSRSMQPAVCFDGAARTGWAGGYFGDGVGATNLAGRTLADLVLGRDTDRSHALWVNPEREKSLVRRLWEPEPLRWLAINLRARWMSWTDRAEARGSPLTPVMNHVLEKIVP